MLPNEIQTLIERAAAIAAERAVELYAAKHPRPTQVTVGQAAEMLGLGRHTVSRMVKAGVIKRNDCGSIPIEVVDRVRS
jgi:plasmid maintenance system antidote protein VapI